LRALIFIENPLGWKNPFLILGKATTADDSTLDAGELA